jgi:hypothetical protein
MTKINLLTLFQEIIAVYYVNHNETHKYTAWQNALLLTVQVGGMYSYRWASKGPHRT